MSLEHLTEAQRRAYLEEHTRVQNAIAPLLKDVQHDIALGALLGLYRALRLRFTCCTLGCAHALANVAEELLAADKARAAAVAAPPAPPAAGNTNLH